jgi:dTDP-4-amino-4,6-dideoxygalactose transaminase
MIKFLDLQQVNARYRDALIQKSTDLIDSGWYIQGKMVTDFEQELAAYIGAKHAIGVANGLDALILILRGCLQLEYLHPGDEVLVPANTYIASILAISETGLVPVLVEPDPETYNVSCAELRKSVTSKTKALLNVHLYGRASWSEELEELLKNYNLLCIEDNAQAIGAHFGNRKTGNLGLASGFSFYPGKNLGCLGDGGAVTTNDDELAQMIRVLGNYGSQKKYQNLVKGVNSRLDELQAGYLSVKLPFLDAENEVRRTIARQYVNGITNPKIRLPEIPADGKEHVWHLFVIRTEERSVLQEYLLEKGIQTMIHYPIPPHKQEAYSEWNGQSFPLTEKIHEEVLSLPMSPVLTDKEVEAIIDAINSF